MRPLLPILTLPKRPLASLGFLLIGLLSSHAQVQTTVFRGKITRGMEAVPFARIQIMHEDKIAGGSITNDKGEFEFLNLNPGTYALEIQDDNGDNHTVTEYTILYGKLETAILDLKKISPEFKAVDIGWVPPPLKNDETFTGTQFGRPDIEGRGVRTPNDLVAAAPGVFVKDDPRKGIQVRGARLGTTAYYVDGVKIFGDPGIPAPALEQVQIITGGIPAEYGDVTGGVVVIQTRNPGMYISRNAGSPPGRKRKKEKKEPDSGLGNFEPLSDMCLNP